MAIHFVNSAARATFSAMSIEALKAYIAKTEENGRKAKAAMSTVDGNRAVSTAIVHGRRVNVSAAESAYNTCRMAWKDAVTILREKESA